MNRSSECSSRQTPVPLRRLRARHTPNREYRAVGSESSLRYRHWQVPPRSRSTHELSCTGAYLPGGIFRCVAALVSSAPNPYLFATSRTLAIISYAW